MGISYASVDNEKKELICNLKEDYIPKIKLLGGIDIQELRTFLYLANRIDYFGKFESGFLPGCAAQLGIPAAVFYKHIEHMAEADLLKITYHDKDRTSGTIDFGVKWYF